MSVGHGENISVAVRIRNGIRIDRAFRRLFNGRNTVPVLSVFAIDAVCSIFTGGTVYTIFTVLSVTPVRTIRYGKGRCFSVRKGHGVCIRFSVTRSLFDRLDTVPILSVLTGCAVFPVLTRVTLFALWQNAEIGDRSARERHDEVPFRANRDSANTNSVCSVLSGKHCYKFVKRSVKPEFLRIRVRLFDRERVVRKIRGGFFVVSTRKKGQRKHRHQCEGQNENNTSLHTLPPEK